MNDFFKRYALIFVVLILVVCIYQYYFINDFKNSYHHKGVYTIGKIKSVESYGRGTGYNFVYNFNIGKKEYESVCDIGGLSYLNARKKIDKSFLVIYLNNDVHNNRIYSNISIDTITRNNQELKTWVDKNSKLKFKIDSIVPSPGYFLQNYF